MALQSTKFQYPMKIHFKIAYFTYWGQRLLVTGNIPELGNGDLSRALLLNFQYKEDWIGEIDIVRDDSFDLKYKYVLFTEQTGQYNEEWGDERKLSFDVKKPDHFFASTSGTRRLPSKILF